MGNQSSALPYDVGERVCSIGGDAAGGWALHRGRKKSSQERVSIFRFDKKAAHVTPLQRELAENLFKRTKTLRHPHVLAFKDGQDTDAEVSLVTDEVVPLSLWLQRLDEETRGDAEKKAAAVGWGLHCALQGLGFLNEDCGLCHGAVSDDNILVTRGGDWKLGGFFVIGAMDPSGPDRLFRECPAIVAQRYQAPERRPPPKWSLLGSAPGGAGPSAPDVYALGVVLFECFNGLVQSEADFATKRGLPRELRKVQELMVSSAPADRPPCKKLLSHPGFRALFRSKLFASLSFLGELQLKSDAERAPFVQALAAQLELDVFPLSVSAHKILPALRDAFHYAQPGMPAQGPGAGGSAAGAKGKKRLSPLSALLLDPFLQISSRVGEAGDAEDVEDVKAVVVPVLVELFASSDRALRVALLQRMASFADSIDDATINDKTDSAPVLRELTIKCVVRLAPKLKAKPLNETLLRHLVALLKDPEPAIRTNTLICLGKVLEHLDEATRAKVILTAFPQSIRDPFVPARMAGLRGLSSALRHLDGDPTALACKVLPSLSFALVDPAPEVRELAFRLVEGCVADLKTTSVARAVLQKKEAEEAKQRDIEARQGGAIGDVGAGAGAGTGAGAGAGIGAGAGVGAGAGAGAGAAAAASAVAAANANRYLSAAAGWAVGSISKSWGGVGAEAPAQETSVPGPSGGGGGASGGGTSGGGTSGGGASGGGASGGGGGGVASGKATLGKGLSLRAGGSGGDSSSALDLDAGDAWGDDELDLGDGDADADAGGGGWGDDDVLEDEALLRGAKPVKPGAPAVNTTAKGRVTVPKGMKLGGAVASTGGGGGGGGDDDFFGDMMKDDATSSSAKAMAKTRSPRSAALRAPTTAATAKPKGDGTTADRAAERDKKREEARQRIAQRRANTNAKATKAKPKAVDSNDDWENW